ncbi:hypothetical protein EYF80_042205 [Liparis tanakae]|uniref:Uncharacterized protein n=1 Tax=Liparis tanakae TaxID=230148 RepID=A0A4Z2G4V0_9TELE|nr:hypothetical protein EYF80_042205 [Liparis tanakae]
MVLHLLQVDGSDLEAEDDDPQQTQDQCAVPVHHVLWTNQIHSNLTGETAVDSQFAAAGRRQRLSGDELQKTDEEDSGLQIRVNVSQLHLLLQEALKFIKIRPTGFFFTAALSVLLSSCVLTAAAVNTSPLLLHVFLTPFLVKTLFIHLVKVFFCTVIRCSCSSRTRPAPSSSPSILIGWKHTDNNISQSERSKDVSE